MKKKLTWVRDIYLQNFLGERDIWPVEEDDMAHAAGYERTQELKDAMESYYIRKTFYQYK